jgi:hypothetical protein
VVGPGYGQFEIRVEISAMSHDLLKEEIKLDDRALRQDLSSQEVATKMRLLI